MYEWAHTSKSQQMSTPPNILRSKLRGNFATSTPDNGKWNESFAVEATSDTIDVQSVQNRLQVAKSKFNESQMDAASLNVMSEVFKDLEMICTELSVVRMKLLSQKYLLNETDNELYVSCINETLAEPSINEENNSTGQTIENVDNESAVGDNEQNICDKIENCKLCEKESQTIESDVGTRIDKETQTSENLTNGIGTKVETNCTKTANALAQNAQNAPIPPPMPNATQIKAPSTSIPIPPPMPHTTLISYSTPPPPPPPMQPFLNSSSSSAVTSTPQSMPPPPPPMPSPMPGNANNFYFLTGSFTFL